MGQRQDGAQIKELLLFAVPNIFRVLFAHFLSLRRHYFSPSIIT